MRLTEINIACVIAMTLFLFGCKQSNPEPESLNPGRDSTETVVFKADTVFTVNSETTLDGAFWEEVQTALDTGHVLVRFAVGEYTLTEPIVVKNIGHDEYSLMISAQAINRCIFEGGIPTLMTLENCYNVRLRGLKFTGASTDHALQIRNSRHIMLENCYMQDLPNISIAALGIYESTTDDIRVVNSRFERIGVDENAHVICVLGGATGLKVVDSYFKDCSGSFILFGGNMVDRGVFFRNDFISTGTYLSGINPAFIEVSASNSTDPGNERMGTNYVIIDNTFSYGNMGNQNKLHAVVFHSSGFNPENRNYRLSIADGEKLQTGTVLDKQNIMSVQLGLEADKIYFGKNVSRNAKFSAVYQYSNSYGSTGSWVGTANIEEALNTEELLFSGEEALTLYD
ncbi:hypothetical protein [Sphingobacterium arenae]|uniref:Right handed beta helix domain-containing protein n=1 Tax=Sphingobacterium arenae TaxID=1280598 RepID=A0ABR7Y2J0_9SPHI|nr:hypothetical protein [Sphingobacterium arenae]MBD1425523.1 hypothetical protein [Sphingobacterium arenae]